MTKSFRIAKLLPLWIALSAIVIIAGSVLFGLFGFNATDASTKTVEVGYSTVVEIKEKTDELEKLCEDAFSKHNLKFVNKETQDRISANYGSKTGKIALIYTFSGSASGEDLNAAKGEIVSSLSSDADFADISVSWHALKEEGMYGSVWRGAVALAVAAVLALVYIGFRFGLGSALTGLALCVNGALVTFALFALTRFPVVGSAVWLFAVLGAVLSLVFWLAECARMRENFKDPSYAALSVEEAVEDSYKRSLKLVLLLIGILAVILIVLGAVATGARWFMLAALLPLVVGAYSSLALAPAVYVPIQAKFARIASKRKQRYVGKKKGEKEAE